MNRKKLWVYDDHKETDILAGPDRLRDLRAFIINNWYPTQRQTITNLHNVGVKEVYVTVKLYSSRIETFNWKEFRKLLDEMKNLGVDGIAIDGEAYSGSEIWYSTNDDSVREFAIEMATTIAAKGLNTIILPEYLGKPPRYKNYRTFLRYFMPDYVLSERTYEAWEPWNLLIYWMRDSYGGNKKIMGIWQDRVPKLLRGIQYFTARLLSNEIFWYTWNKF